MKCLIDAEWNIVACGINTFIPHGINMPDYIDNVRDWKYINNMFVNTRINYQYVIIPTDLIPELVNMSGLVDDVLTGEEFTVYLSDIEITTGNGKKKGVKTLPVSFTPCTVIEWEDGDDERLQSVIDMFNNMYNHLRFINFKCKFDNLNDLNTFKENNSYI